MTEIHIPRSLHSRFREDFGERVEHVGFFLADYDNESRSFVVRDWRAMAEKDYEIQTDFHVSLKDNVRGEIIKWAWDEHASLIEIHSHGARFEAEFSPSDMMGFEEWVPHLWWRLRGRPYAAIVTAGETTDAMAWVEAADRPEQVSSIRVDDEILVPTGNTIARRGR